MLNVRILNRLVCFICISVFAHELCAMDKAVDARLDNDLCTKLDTNGHKEVVLRARDPELERILGIILHYTVCQSVESTLEAYYGKGVSAHYLVGHDGSCRCHADPSLLIAFHAGVSQFRGMTSLNKYFIGIEHVNPGYVETGVEYGSIWGTPTRLLGDSRYWFGFSESQFETSALLTVDLQRKFKIRGSLVITHADAAIGRKSDIGPMYNYERAFTHFGAGYFFPRREMDLSTFSRLTDDDYMRLIRLYGYGSGNNDMAAVIKAFQMHFSTMDISGELSDTTKKSILGLCIDYAQYKDPHCYNTTDERFSEGLRSFMRENPERTGGFNEFL